MKNYKRKRNKVYELWEFAEFDENENNKIEIRVNWKESNKQHSQVLKLKMYYGRTNYILRRVKDFYYNAIPLIFYLAIYKHDNDKGYWKNNKQRSEEYEKYGS